MTDGIIQKVINELIEDIENAGYQAQQLEYDTISYQNEINMLNKLKQELIEMIMTKLPHECPHCHEGFYTSEELVAHFYEKHMFLGLQKPKRNKSMM